jgi:hypothetical protein
VIAAVAPSSFSDSIRMENKIRIQTNAASPARGDPAAWHERDRIQYNDFRRLIWHVQL